MELREALYTTRAMRRVSPDPVPEDAIARLIDAAIRAPSGGNTQIWRFLSVTDADTRAELGGPYLRAWEQLQSTVYAGRQAAAEVAGDAQTLAVMRSSQWLADHAGEVPLWVLAFHRNDASGASI